jgi:hypothetical protein
MIVEIMMYTVKCDNCGCDVFDNLEFSCLNDKNDALEMAMESDWTKDGDKNYCPDCYYYNDDDNLIINENKKVKKD